MMFLLHRPTKSMKVTRIKYSPVVGIEYILVHKMHAQLFEFSLALIMYAQVE